MTGEMMASSSGIIRHITSSKSETCTGLFVTVNENKKEDNMRNLYFSNFRSNAEAFVVLGVLIR